MTSKKIHSLLLLLEIPPPPPPNQPLLFLSGAICVNRPYSLPHLPLSGAICVNAHPPPSTTANRPVSAVTLQGRTTWQHWTSEPLPISERDMSVMSALWHAWFTRLHTNHDIILAERSRRSDWISIGYDTSNGTWFCVDCPVLKSLVKILHPLQESETWRGQDKLYQMGEESATGWLIS